MGQRPWTGLIGLLSQAAELGLRVIVTARATGSAHAVMTAPLLRRLNELQATTIMLSGNPQDSGKIRGHRFSRLPAGRAMLLDDGDAATFVQLVNPFAAEGAAHDNPRTKEGSSTDDSARSPRRPHRGELGRGGADRTAGRRPRGAAPLVTAVLPPAADPVSLQTAAGFSAHGPSTPPSPPKASRNSVARASASASPARATRPVMRWPHRRT